MNLFNKVPLLLFFFAAISTLTLAQKNSQWVDIKKSLTPPKKKSKHMAKEENDELTSLKKSLEKDYDIEKRKLIRKNKKEFKQKLLKMKAQKLASETEKNEKILNSLKSERKINIKLWLKTQKYLKQINGYLKYL